jgi:hypothetical protein
MGQRVHARGGSEAGGQPQRQLRVQNGHVGRNERAAELQLDATGVVLDHRGNGDLAAGAGRGWDRNERAQGAVQHARAFVVQERTALRKNDIHALGRVDHAAAADGNEYVAVPSPGERSSPLHHQHLGIGRHVVKDAHHRHAGPGQSFHHTIHQSGLAQDLVGDNDRPAAADLLGLKAHLAHHAGTIENPGPTQELKEIWQRHAALLQSRCPRFGLPKSGNHRQRQRLATVYTIRQHGVG